MTRQEADPSFLVRGRRIEWAHFRHRFSCLGYDEGLSLRSLLNQPRQMLLRFMDVDRFHHCLAPVESAPQNPR
ncbi:hypothetical protein CDO30_30020 (plasmid) [Sinorhizobium meliloti]|uniref:Uncharacterized protein n=1 Tax=Rhizobium meliloti (strain 1021) TaxID=266834 RepID=Q92V48_RHIME|nr:Hypothetical protein SM2011_b21666 [Sinorhizobium meliloti 2011]ASP62415.1 hypothetical protein CDO30_30020 [Sinorhizobium meliloti]PTD22362.1 hypothetical protein C5N13_30250 [Sinorhizobium meliloti]CAC49269.1 hypothetical protein SM_b21666 [Sinorhizobium meliloti 1021]